MHRHKTDLTPRELMVFDFIREYRERHKYPPTIREIMHALNFSGPSHVRYCLTNLETYGMITRTPGAARSIVVTETAG